MQRRSPQGYHEPAPRWGRPFPIEFIGTPRTFTVHPGCQTGLHISADNVNKKGNSSPENEEVLCNVSESTCFFSILRKHTTLDKTGKEGN